MGSPYFIPSDEVKRGRNAEHPQYRDSGYVKCSNCGFVCHLDRDMRAPNGSRAGSGVRISDNIDYDDTISYDLKSVKYDGSYTDDRLSTAPSGCPLCGCLRYDQYLEK